MLPITAMATAQTGNFEVVGLSYSPEILRNP
jgi:hypothetical protein